MPRPSTLTLAALACPALPGRLMAFSRLSRAPLGARRALLTSSATRLSGRRT